MYTRIDVAHVLASCSWGLLFFTWSFIAKDKIKVRKGVEYLLSHVKALCLGTEFKGRVSLINIEKCTQDVSKPCISCAPTGIKIYGFGHTNVGKHLCPFKTSSIDHAAPLPPPHRFFHLIWNFWHAMGYGANAIQFSASLKLNFKNYMLGYLHEVNGGDSLC